MPESAKKSIKVLDPMERILEILFGLIMVLTITCSFSIGEAGRTEVRNMLIGALGCNLAWGVIDAVMYWMACFSARGRAILALREVRRADDPAAAHQVIADAMPPLLASVMVPPHFEQIRLKLNQLPEPPERPHLVKKDWLGGIAVFLVVVIATLPVLLPFVFIEDPARALRISNGVAITMLLLTGYAFGRYVGNHPWKMGLAMVLLGAAMVGMTIALGG